MSTTHYPLTEEDFKANIEQAVIAYKNRLGRPSKVSLYQFFCAVLYVLRTGIPWRDLPSFYGPWHTIYTRFKRWSQNGLFWHLLYALQQKKKVTLDLAWIDSTRVGLHRPGAGHLKNRPHSTGCGRKGMSTKIHVGVAPGRLKSACLSEDQGVDRKISSRL